MNKICFDYGHGGIDPGAVYKGRRESQDNLSIGMAVARELRKQGIKVDETRISDITVSLKQRSDFENKSDYDFFISFHRNAFKAEAAKGAETYVYLTGSFKSRLLAEKLQKVLVDVGYVNRGIKTANYHVLKETKSPSILIELGFIDNTRDNEIFDNKRMEIVHGITKAITTHLGVAYKTDASLISNANEKKKLYKVQVGAYSSKNTAEAMLLKLEKAGFDGYIKQE